MVIKDLLNKEKIYISVSIVDDKKMKELNNEYLQKDYPTDVLSFEIGEIQNDGTYYLGDVVVNQEQAKRQAGEYGNDLEKEISELVEHGVLHLLGVHHEENDKGEEGKTK
jgi:probable rRNA maturation factor